MMRLDTVVQAETPEGLELTLRPAGVVPRAYALLLDWLIRAMLFATLGAVLAEAGGVGAGAYLILFFVLEWFYPVFFELTFSGATPGKRMLGIRVVMDDGLPVTPAASLVRNLLRVADFMPFAFGFGVACMLWRPDFKRLGDLAAGTLVVYHVRPGPAPALPEQIALAPPVPLSRDAQATMVALAARAGRLTPERVEELAALIPEHVLPRSADPLTSRSKRLFALARWLVGHRAG